VLFQRSCDAASSSHVVVCPLSLFSLISALATMAFSSLNPAIEMRVRQPDQPSPRLQRIVSFEESEMPTLRTTAGVSPERAVEELGQEVESLTAHDVSLRKLEVQALVAEVGAGGSRSGRGGSAGFCLWHAAVPGPARVLGPAYTSCSDAGACPWIVLVLANTCTLLLVHASTSVMPTGLAAHLLDFLHKHLKLPLPPRRSIPRNLHYDPNIPCTHHFCTFGGTLQKKVAEGCDIAITLGKQLAAANRLNEAVDLLSTALCIQVSE